MKHRVRGTVAFVLAIAIAGPLGAQERQSAEDHLARRISVRFDQLELGAALARLRTVFGIPLAYSLEALPAGKKVSLAADDQPASQILAAVLEGTGLRPIPTAGGTIVISADGAAASTHAGGKKSHELVTGIQQLDQIVVMGTPVAGAPEREQPNAVSVVHGDDLLAYRYSRTVELMRTMLPGVMVWDRGPGGPPSEIAAVRGASSFTARGIKTYVDGVELASPMLFTLLDPRSIDRIEVIRGPQGAALYGSDAINGVIHIVTRKGRIGEGRSLRGWATASAGPFDQQTLGSTTVRQSHAGALEWAGASASLQADGNLDFLGSAQSAPATRGWGLHTGGQAASGSLLLSATLRATWVNFRQDQGLSVPSPTDPPAASEVQAATISASAIHQTSNRWTQTIVVGIDRADGAIGTSRPLFASFRQPLAATHEDATRSSLRFHSAMDADIASGATLSSTVGFEYSSLDRKRGAYEWDDGAQHYETLYGDQLVNAGTFVQSKLKFSGLVLSAGLRSEWNSSVGIAAGSSVASSLGASWTRPIGGSVVRLRAGWGRGLRPPEPGMSLGMAASYYRQEPNDRLSAEVQTGVELGAEIFSGPGVFGRLTLFNQNATDLIQSVALPSLPGTQQNYQFQNVGAIKNRGVEVEAGVRSGAFGADFQLYYTRSTIERLSPSYSGSLRVGDELPETPSAAGAARITWKRDRFRAALGTSYLGSWRGYDWQAMARVVTRLDLPKPAPQDYLMKYPAIFKPYLTASLDFGNTVGAFLTIDNITNVARFERHNGNPPSGRSLLFGIEVRP